jgi:hypothetical protein
MGRSCGNRHCPTCQQDKTKAWLENQTDRLLPCPYFLLTFTVPAGLRDLVRSHQRIAYAALFEASSAAIKTLARNPKPNTSAPRTAVSSACCTPGAARSIFIHTSTTSSLAVVSAKMGPDGYRHALISFCL